MSRLDFITLFIQVAEQGSFAAVAEQLGVDRSVVTRQIAALEKQLGVQLIIRSTRKQALTSAGRLYLERAKAIIDLVESAESEIQEERLLPKGMIRISLPLSFGVRHLAPVLARFVAQYPEVNLHLEYDDNLVNTSEQGLDLAIRVTHEPAPNDIVRRLGECRLMMVGSPDYLKRYGVPVHPSELTEHICLQYRQNSRWVFEVEGKTVAVNTSGRVQANNGDALAQAAVHGLGLTMLPDFIAWEYLENGLLLPVLDDYCQSKLGIYAVLPTNHYIPQRVRILLEYLIENLPAAFQRKNLLQ